MAKEDRLFNFRGNGSYVNIFPHVRYRAYASDMYTGRSSSVAAFDESS